VRRGAPFDGIFDRLDRLDEAERQAPVPMAREHMLGELEADVDRLAEMLADDEDALDNARIAADIRRAHEYLHAHPDQHRAAPAGDG
jgi:hypothetical protein